jgi:hypothetical protein
MFLLLLLQIHIFERPLSHIQNKSDENDNTREGKKPSTIRDQEIMFVGIFLKEK